MSKVFDFIKEAGIFYLATTDGDQPKIRPLGAVIEADGKVIFGVGTFKDVYKQLTANPKVEIVACKPNAHWIRYTGKVVFETDDKYAAEMIPAFHLEAVYNEQTGNKLACFHLEDATAYEIAVMGQGESLL